ncbi:hypothetical protein R3P38DRAFT_3242406 [Favolaschia claudopus]|uniref:Uncharacterized protein n=1 Tax=Favolaschia claudopus TaxID=2862362 RepID=A0AAV9Z647_9AGAR
MSQCDADIRVRGSHALYLTHFCLREAASDKAALGLTSPRPTFLLHVSSFSPLCSCIGPRHRQHCTLFLRLLYASSRSTFPPFAALTCLPIVDCNTCSATGRLHPAFRFDPPLRALAAPTQPPTSTNHRAQCLLTNTVTVSQRVVSIPFGTARLHIHQVNLPNNAPIPTSMPPLPFSSISLPLTPHPGLYRTPVPTSPSAVARLAPTSNRLGRRRNERFASDDVSMNMALS